MWRTEGLIDLTRFQHKAVIFGSQGSTSLQPTTSAVDEGEPGKVKALYDIVFDEACDRDSSSGLAIEVLRGGASMSGFSMDLKIPIGRSARLSSGIIFLPLRPFLRRLFWPEDL